MPDAHANFAYSTVATAPSPATSGTSLVVASGDGSKFPAVPFNATVWPASSQPTSANAEIVRVTARSTDTLTITRSQEGTSARTIVVGDQIAATITAKAFTDIESNSASAQDAALAPAAAIAVTLDRTTATFTATTPLTSGTLYLASVFIAKDTTVTSITWVSAGTGMSGGTHAWFALYDNNRNLLRQSTDDTTPSWGTNTAKTYNLSSAYLTTYSGLYYLGMLVVATSVPNIVGASSSNSIATLLSPAAQGTANTGLTGTAPNPASALGGTNISRAYGFCS